MLDVETVISSRLNCGK